MSNDVEVRVGQLNLLRGKDQLPIGGLNAGDIGAVLKLGQVPTSGTLCDPKSKFVLPPITQPEPIVQIAIHPVTQADVSKMSETLARLSGEDPTLHAYSEPATREMILAGMGTAHLDIAVKKAKSKFGLNLETSTPLIPYRETITINGDAEYTHKKQSGGSGQYGRVTLQIESLADDVPFEFGSGIFGGSVSAPFVAATEKGCRLAIEAGPLAGFPVTGVKATITDGKEHPVDSKEIAFQTAGREAFRMAMMGARTGSA